MIDIRRRVLVLLLAAVLVAGAVVARFWLAATGSYSHGELSAPVRAGSTLALVGGFALAGVVVAWPMPGPGRRRGAEPGAHPNDEGQGTGSW